MSGDAERPPVRLEGREHRNGKWKKYSEVRGGRDRAMEAGSGEGESRVNKKKMKRKNGRKENKKSFLYRPMKPA